MVKHSNPDPARKSSDGEGRPVRQRFDLALPEEQASYVRRRATQEDRNVTTIIRRMIAHEMETTLHP